MKNKNDLPVCLFRAYYDARRHKRNTINQLDFEMDLEHNLVELAREIESRTYRVSPCTGFMIHKPVSREIFAADFRDRVVHHLLVNDIGELADASFITDCYSCRKGYGTSYGIKRLVHHILSCTDNYRQKAYVLKMDIQGYFMSIDRALLYDKTENLLLKYAGRKNRNGVYWEDTFDMERTLYLLKEIIFHNPVQDSRLKGYPTEWATLPCSKSLFYSRRGCGLPIGNLTSQLFSNIYLTEFDHYIKRTLGIKHYGRYVDDFYMVHQDRALLKTLPPVIACYLKDNLGLTLHPRKTELQDVEKGINFLGATIKPYRRYLIKRTRKSICLSVNRIDNLLRQRKAYRKNALNRHRASINSFLGYAKQFKTYKLREKMVAHCRNMLRLGIFSRAFDRFDLADVQKTSLMSLYTYVRSLH